MLGFGQSGGVFPGCKRGYLNRNDIAVLIPCMLSAGSNVSHFC